jgi:hypothetical protein
VDKERLALWRELCEFLASIPGHSTYPRRIPNHLRVLVVPARQTKAERESARLIFYSGGWGWRLHLGWQERLAELEQEIVNGERCADGRH